MRAKIGGKGPMIGGMIISTLFWGRYRIRMVLWSHHLEGMVDGELSQRLAQVESRLEGKMGCEMRNMVEIREKVSLYRSYDIVDVH